ncbi:hypothetical protein C8A05DRAFT_34427 [Staphylotrichum tortipilum]|uniref:C2H2-type domain-containing protein n=1 Tax=Staphylotrichum tortipilum TaxID=2831512 RepID=A0AAN6RSK3_9PEZI|nr:hypothetical protein C8A05DRAFT_34427 [Staphylotrichum longicolle]
MASRSSITPPPPPSLLSPSTNTKNNNDHSRHRKSRSQSRSGSRHSSTRTRPEGDADRRQARETLVSRKKKEIVDKSMALFALTLEPCLKNPISPAALASSVGAGLGGAAAAAGAGVRRAMKRAREEEEEDGGPYGMLQGAYQNDGKGNVKSEAGVRTKKKKVNPKEVDGPKFACPFARHDPAKYRSVKTCCGPGWGDVHRIKEHVYRKHSLKNFCPRCLDHFDKPELLKAHQRADEPCAVRRERAGPAADAITDEQEKLLRARAKSHCSDEDKWAEMYRAIFPGEKVPSPYYEAPPSPSPAASAPPAATPVCPPTKQHPPSTNPISRLQNTPEFQDFLRAEILKQARQFLEHYVSFLFDEVQEKVNHKTLEIAREVETRILRIIRFQEDQAAAVPGYPAATTTTAATNHGLLVSLPPSGAPSPPPSPGELTPGKVGEMLLRGGEPFESGLCGEMPVFDMEELLAGFGGYAGAFDGADSAYYTGSGSGSGEEEGFDGYGNGGY